MKDFEDFQMVLVERLVPGVVLGLVEEDNNLAVVVGVVVAVVEVVGIEVVDIVAVGIGVVVVAVVVVHTGEHIDKWVVEVVEEW